MWLAFKLQRNVSGQPWEPHFFSGQSRGSRWNPGRLVIFSRNRLILP